MTQSYVSLAGILTLNGQEYTGEAGGAFRGLDLVEDMYLGGVPNYNAIARNAGFRQGFVGKCADIRSYILTLKVLNF